MTKWIIMLLLAGAAVFESLGDVSFRYSAILSKKEWLIIGIILYAVGTGIWAYTLRFEDLSDAIIIVDIINLILVTLVGIFIFHEQTSMTNAVGIVLGIISIILLQF